jgi:hypothetical protein
MRMLRLFLTVLLLQLQLLPITLSAQQKNTPELIINQFKVTSSDGQFFMLFNNTSQTIDMGTVQLVYYNHYDFSQATSSKIIGLTGSLPAGGYYLINDGPFVLCQQAFVNSISLNFSSTKGSVQLSLLKQTAPGEPIFGKVQDAISWSKTSVNSVTKTPTNTTNFLLRSPRTSINNPDISEPGGGSWQEVSPDESNFCSYIVKDDPAQAPVPTLPLLLLAPTPPPARIVSIFSQSNAASNPNHGLQSPMINEILPNPGTPLTDSEDEFIEIYNPNDKNFIMTDFYIQVGTEKKRKWKFPDGLYLGPKTYSVFTSNDFSVSLTNSGGQVSLLAPDEKVISQTKPYGTARDNLAWSLAEGEWYWTTTPTPGKPNIITAQGLEGGAVLAQAQTGQSSPNYTGSNNGNQASNNQQPNSEVTTLHPTSLASVAALAVGYGAYEYKQDIANKYRQYRSYRTASRKSGK